MSQRATSTEALMAGRSGRGSTRLEATLPYLDSALDPWAGSGRPAEASVQCFLAPLATTEASWSTPGGGEYATCWQVRRLSDVCLALMHSRFATGSGGEASGRQGIGCSPRRAVTTKSLGPSPHPSGRCGSRIGATDRVMVPLRSGRSKLKNSMPSVQPAHGKVYS